MPKEPPQISETLQWHT